MLTATKNIMTRKIPPVLSPPIQTTAAKPIKNPTAPADPYFKKSIHPPFTPKDSANASPYLFAVSRIFFFRLSIVHPFLNKSLSPCISPFQKFITATKSSYLSLFDMSSYNIIGLLSSMLFPGAHAIKNGPRPSGDQPARLAESIATVAMGRSKLETTTSQSSFFVPAFSLSASLSSLIGQTVTICFEGDISKLNAETKLFRNARQTIKCLSLSKVDAVAGKVRIPYAAKFSGGYSPGPLNIRLALSPFANALLTSCAALFTAFATSFIAFRSLKGSLSQSASALLDEIKTERHSSRANNFRSIVETLLFRVFLHSIIMLLFIPKALGVCRGVSLNLPMSVGTGGESTVQESTNIGISE